VRWHNIRLACYRCSKVNTRYWWDGSHSERPVGILYKTCRLLTQLFWSHHNFITLGPITFDYHIQLFSMPIWIYEIHLTQRCRSRKIHRHILVEFKNAMAACTIAKLITDNNLSYGSAVVPILSLLSPSSSPRKSVHKYTVLLFFCFKTNRLSGCETLFKIYVCKYYCTCLKKNRQDNIIILYCSRALPSAGWMFWRILWFEIRKQ